MLYNFIFILVGLGLVFLSYICMKFGSKVGMSDDEDKKTSKLIRLNEILDPNGFKGPVVLQIILIALFIFILGVFLTLIGIVPILRAYSNF